MLREVENSVVGANSTVGQRPEEMENKEDWGVAVIGPGCKLPANSVVGLGEEVGSIVRK